jgi:MFS family permease
MVVLGMELWFLIGLISLILFFGVIVASLLGFIPQDRLPIQSALVLMTFIIAGIAFVGNLLDDSIGQIGFIDLEGQIIIHPITALAAGFLAAVLLVNLPTIIAMPCGRILAAALMPAALGLGYKVAKRLGDPRMVGVIVFAFIVNAAASCGPSPLGGIGLLGEGLAKLPLNSLSDPQQTGIIIATGVCALVMKFITPLFPADMKQEDIKKKEEEVVEVANDGGVRDLTVRAVEEPQKEIPSAPQAPEPQPLPEAPKEKESIFVRMSRMDTHLKNGYITLGLFMIVLALTLILQPKIPIQTILVVLALVIMLVGRASIQDLMAGVILHPIMAMSAGFLIAGAMGLAGGFDVLLILLEGLAEFEIAGFAILGYLGVAIILVNIPTIMPMPCGRILAAALVPGVFKYGETLVDITGNAIVMPVLLGAFIVNAAASCGPSPLGGIGGIGEGNMGVEIGSSGKSQQVGILFATGVTALVIAFVVGVTMI